MIHQSKAGHAECDREEETGGKKDDGSDGDQSLFLGRMDEKNLFICELLCITWLLHAD
jgi:hypothetical protein